MTTIQDFDFSVDVLRALLWQYNDAANLEGLLRAKQAFYQTNQREFWENWQRDVFDLRTANEFGLSVWASILNVPFFTDSEVSPADYPAFGFDTGETDSITNFNRGNFATSSDTFINLSVEQRRLLLRLRYFQLVTTATVPEINEFATILLGDTNSVYVIDNLNMTISYVFTTIPPSNLLLVAQQFDIIPRPSGVEVNIVIAPLARWGFGEFRRNFGRGNFFGGGA